MYVRAHMCMCVCVCEDVAAFSRRNFYIIPTCLSINRQTYFNNHFFSLDYIIKNYGL